MKRVLFIGVTNYDFRDEARIAHFRKKFEGLGQGIKPYVLAKGRPFFRNVWGAEFYLLPPGIFFWPLALVVAAYLVFKHRIEVIVAQSPLMEGFTGAILKKIFRKKLIVEIHGDWKEGPFLSKRRRFESLQRKFIPVLARFSLRAADKIRAVSSYTKDRALEISGPKPYFVFPAFTDLTLFLGEKDTKFDNFILFVGQLEKVKGVEYFIEAFTRISPEFPDFKLVIVGEGSERKNLELGTRALKSQDRVTFKGKLPLEGVRDIMKNCYCLVLPSLSEGLGRVIMEAQALGKPVVASRVGGIPDLIRDGQNGFLFRVGDKEELATKLRALMADKSLAQKMGEAGRRFIAENFSNEKYIQNYLEMINC